MNNEEQRKHAAEIAAEIGRKLDEELRDLRADLEICEAATAGPWIPGNGYEQSMRGNYVFSEETGEVVCAEQDETDTVLRTEDARFIAAARTGWPTAIRRALDAEERQHTLEAEVMANWREIAQLKAEIERLRGVIDGVYSYLAIEILTAEEVTG